MAEQWIERQLAERVPGYNPSKHQSLLREGLLVSIDGRYLEWVPKDMHEARLLMLGYERNRKDINCLFDIYIRRHHG